ncbi:MULTISPECIES: hypothetical protein [unclassified Microcoleus]|nr:MULTISPECIES: hypothetical protein [unclassified Microcoleus]
MLILPPAFDRPPFPHTKANGRSHAPVLPISKFPDILLAKSKSLRV